MNQLVNLKTIKISVKKMEMIFSFNVYLKIIILFSVCVCLVCVYEPKSQGRSEECIGSRRMGVTGSREPQCGCWGLKPGAHQAV